MPPRQARRRGGRTIPLNEVHTLAENLQQRMQQQIDDLTREVQRLRVEANNPPPSAIANEYNGDSSSSKSVQSYPRRRNALYRAQIVQEPDWEKEIKRDIPEFSGTDFADEIIDWLTLVNEVFEYRNVPEDRQVGIITMRLRGKAIAWWRCEKQTGQSAGKAPITS